MKTNGPIDGQSILPLLKDASATLDRDAIHWHFPHFSNEGGRPSSAIRAGRWKLIEHLESGKVELYDLEADLGETVDLAEKTPGVTKRLRTMLQQWRRDVGAEMPTRKPECKARKIGRAHV